MYEYIAPLTGWLHDHPVGALIVVFCVAFGESLAVIGSILPGSVTMTALGILAGSGVISMRWTFVVAIIGAIAGDSLSYVIGYIYQDKLGSMWPFKKYPKWLAYGKQYFERHGGKSVLLGRFIGPLRSIIPLIAGMMSMNPWRFLIVNALSALAWAFVYVMPGVLIGSASTTLSSQGAKRLVIFVLAVLGGLWLLSLSLKWAWQRLDKWLAYLGAWSAKHPRFARLIEVSASSYIAPNDAALRFFAIFILLSLWTCMVMFTAFGVLTTLNQEIMFFLSSIRTPNLDKIFLFLSGFQSLTTQAILALFMLLQFKGVRRYHWVLLVLVTILLGCFTDFIAGQNWHGNTLMIATAQFTAIALCVEEPNRPLWRLTWLLLLFISSLSLLCLGDLTLTDCLIAWAGGMSMGLMHSITTAQPSHYGKTFFMVLVATLVFLSTHYTHLVTAHEHPKTYHFINDATWWNDDGRALPRYRLNRIGRPIEPFNVQYAGSLSALQTNLREQGWQDERDSFWRTLLKKINHTPTHQVTPLLPPLYLNEKASLFMIYAPQKEPLQLLRLWRSDYFLNTHHAPIWLGILKAYPDPSRLSFAFLVEGLADDETKEVQMDADFRLLKIWERVQ